MLEVGRAQRTYLRSRAEQREVNAGLNVAESWNGANAQIAYGKAGDIATNRRDDAEMTVLCRHILQAAMVYVNTLMIQDVLAEPDWAQGPETPALWMSFGRACRWTGCRSGR
jgi:TnpA family transposase